MIREKTAYGVINKLSIGNCYAHSSFSKDFKSLVEKEDDIAMTLINNGYDILDKKIYYVGGGIQEGVDTYVNLESGDYSLHSYEYVEHGVWKLKFKIKKRK
jgi:hypothetical protein|tara:strand:+ start:172 stop:474 length:303 start_codon:yes stop_codon:yes gene_type:complete